MGDIAVLACLKEPSVLKKLLAAIGVGTLVALGGAAAAHADVPVTLTADPSTITLGQSSTLTAAGLEDGLEAIFSISVPTLPNDEGMLDPESVTVAGGTAVTVFTPNAAGTYVIDVSTPFSEGPIASVTVTVQAPPEISLTADPTTITLGQSSTITAAGLDDGLQAIFSISLPVLPNDQGMLNPESVAVAGGTAVTVFTPNAAGTYVIDLSTPYSEGPIKSVTITVLAAPVTPTTPVLPATGGEDVSPLVLWTGIGAVLLGAALVTAQAVRNRSQKG